MNSKIPSELSGNMIKKLDGFSANIKGQRISSIPAILIGQFGKSDPYKKSITGDDIMQYCLNTILDGQARLGGRIIMLECKDIPYLVSLYEKFGFHKIEECSCDDDLLTMVRFCRKMNW